MTDTVGANRDQTVRLSEIFFSLQGEAARSGLPTVFIRLTGCPLRCTWCDTEYAFTGGTPTRIEDVLAEVARYPTRYVCVTGGEPLAQKSCLPLLKALCDAGHDVCLETSGALDITLVDPRVARIMDLKAPGSGETDKNLLSNIPDLRQTDEVKIVIASRADYDWAKEIIAAHQLSACCDVVLSPVAGQLNPTDLAEWILADGLAVRFQIQLHKLLWSDARGK
ncbi:7-carboxy-7-deazaguanine synthase QueE [Fluviibacter phosphoraccumulans]|jgi:7-carboxy-7-deazaguanine synthase|uniref:7-carboxy-7-deazaguanine synthase n=1 Tax=Fluviibacter phosphoraccumulans TaxID=1751046 RepID=A0A679HQI6_9RHOO|nr:7-carboxy-7-deazaguanine synthase QueE [Fluviibacter phosphoraccumulans]BBU68503.1 7-carboxy-7-deazaguanine synthase [Fluviibacter phosphoraccumulans]BBU72342.1 7-carboxy-7-deazaguanine synthase [Fluviibacter phosphoraccumulans]BCA64416.1 7-carboxy-7-deazaguanine synthase [Fluviibacter phosphoraccumulans]